jgi:hypothetical protein
MPIEQVAYTLMCWSRRIYPIGVCISGGEPLLHPDIKDILGLAKQCFPNTVLRLYTNGALISKRIEAIADTLRAVNACVVISVRDWKAICRRDWLEDVKKGIQCLNEEGIWVELKNRGWIQLQAGDMPDGRPAAFHVDPKVAYKHCDMKPCSRFVHENTIWNCPVAFKIWEMHAYKEVDSEEWKEILTAPYGTSDMSREELLEFFKKDSGPWCANCIPYTTYTNLPASEFPTGVTCNYKLDV